MKLTNQQIDALLNNVEKQKKLEYQKEYDLKVKENNITRFYLWGSSKHPVWNKVATNTGFEEYRGTDYASSIYTLDIEQLNNIN